MLLAEIIIAVEFILGTLGTPGVTLHFKHRIRAGANSALGRPSWPFFLKPSLGPDPFRLSKKTFASTDSVQPRMDTN
jgi:hypothetical protein